jgi:hypothetical protein
LPIKKGRCGTMTHDYKRHGTTTLLAALDAVGSTRCRHRQSDWPAYAATSPSGMAHVLSPQLGALKDRATNQALPTTWLIRPGRTIGPVLVSLEAIFTGESRRV